MINILWEGKDYSREKRFVALTIWNCIRSATKSHWSGRRGLLEHYMLIYVTEGRLDIELDNLNISINKNEVFISRPNKMFRATAPQNISTVFYSVEFDCDTHSFLALFFPEKEHHKIISGNEKLEALFYSLNANYKRRECGQYLHEAMLLMIFDELDRSHRADGEAGKIYDRVCEYIWDNINKRLTAQDISIFLGYNKDYLCRLIKICSGKTLKEVIINEKLITAKNLLLTTDYSNAKIAV